MRTSYFIEARYIQASYSVGTSTPSHDQKVKARSIFKAYQLKSGIFPRIKLRSSPTDLDYCTAVLEAFWGRDRGRYQGMHIQNRHDIDQNKHFQLYFSHFEGFRTTVLH